MLCEATAPHRQGNALLLAMGGLLLVAAIIAVSTTEAASSHDQQRRSSQSQSALAALDAVLSRRESRLRTLAQHGNSDEFVQWKNFDFDFTGNGSAPGVATDKNYGEDIVGNFRVRWKIEPMIVESPDQASLSQKKYITNPPPSTEVSHLPGEAGATDPWQVNNTKFLYRLAGESILYQNPEDPAAPNNAILARAQGVRFVSASNSPLFRYVIFYAQRGPKGDLEMTHGGTVNVNGHIHSNGAIYLGGDTKAMAWSALGGASVTRIGPTDPVDVVGVDGIFMLNKAVMYGAFNYPLFMTPQASGDTRYRATAGTHFSDRTTTPGGTVFPLDASPNYGDQPASTVSGTTINPYRLMDGSGVVTTDSNRTINGVGIRGAAPGVSQPNDARDAFRLAGGGLPWTRASTLSFLGKARTLETGGREVVLDPSLEGRPLEPQQLLYHNFPHSPALDESTREEYALPKFVSPPPALAPPAAPPITVAAPLAEAAGYYLAQAMGSDMQHAVSVRYDGTMPEGAWAGAARPVAMTGWRLDAGPTPKEKVGLIIRERMRPDRTIWGDQGYGPRGTDRPPIVPGGHPEFMPYAYGKYQRPFSLVGFNPVNLGIPAYTNATPSNHNVNLLPLWTKTSYADGQLTVQASTGPGNTGIANAWNINELKTRYSDHIFSANPRRVIHVGDDTVPLNAFVGACVKVNSVAGATDGYVGLTLMPGGLANTTPQCTLLTASVTATATSLTLDNVVGINVNTLLMLNGLEVVQVTSVAVPTRTVTVVRGYAGSTAVAHAANVNVTWGGTFPALCRLTAAVADAAQTIFSVDDVSRLAVDDVVRLLTESVRITAINAATKRVTVLRGVDGSVAAPSFPVGTAMHWAERAPYVAMCYSPGRGFFMQQRRYPSQTLTSPPAYWNGDGTPGAAPAGGVPALVALNQADATPSLAQGAKVDVTQVYNTWPNAAQTIGPNVAWPNVAGNLIWTEEGTTYSIGQYGTCVSMTGKWNQSVGRWQLNVRLGANVPAGVGFYDPTPTVLNDRGDLGKSLALVTSAVNPATIAGTWAIGALTAPFGFGDMYGGVTLYGTNQLFGTPPPPPALAGSQRVNMLGGALVPTAAAADQVWEQVSSGFYDAAARRISVYNAWGIPALGAIGGTYTIPAGQFTGWTLERVVHGFYNPSLRTIAAPVIPADITTPYVIPAGTYAGWTLRPATAMPIPGVFPAAPAGPSDFRNVTGSVGASPLTVRGIGFSVQRSPQNFDTNPYTGSGSGWFTPAVPAYLPPSSWIAPPSTRSFRPDMWRGAAAPVAASRIDNGLISTSGTSWMNANGVHGAQGGAQGDDVAVATPPPPEIWIGMHRYNPTTGAPSTVTTDPIGCYYYSGTTPPPAFPVGYTRLVTATPINVNDLAMGNTGTLPPPGGDPFGCLVGPTVASQTLGTPTTGVFSQYRCIRTAAGSAGGTTETTFDTAGGDLATYMTRYLRSQYQVWFGTQDITDDFFAYGQASPATRLATEDWFFQPREFWSQSRWWNEEFQAPTTVAAPGATPTAGAVFAPPAPGVNELIEKDDSGNPGSGAGDNPTNRSTSDNRRLFAKTTVLTLNLGNIQAYLKARAVNEATRDPSDTVTATMASTFNGLLYVARTNRAPFVPDLNRFVAPGTAGFPLRYGRGILYDAASGAWLSNLAEFGRAVTGSDNYNNGYADALWDPWTRGPMVLKSAIPGAPSGTPGTLDNGGVPDIGGPVAAVPVLDPVVANPEYLVPNHPSYNTRITPRFRPCEFHHGVRVVNGAAIDWGYGSNGPRNFGDTKLDIITPNQLYIQGDLNTYMPMVTMKNGNIEPHVAPLAVMGDVVTLLSNAWKDANYQVDGLTVSPRGVSGAGTLARRGGALAVDTTYNMCILTHNIPTSKATLRFGEASSFVNTMMFLENWSGTTMRYMGSLVVMNSRRYSQAYLLEQPKVSGRTPFGWAGWNCQSASGGTIPIVPPGGAWGDAFAPGTGFLDWICGGGAASNNAGSADELVPFDYPASMAAPRTVALPTDGIPPVYVQPNRVFVFNGDLLTEEGTPPSTPYGNEVRGLGAWSRVVE